ALLTVTETVFERPRLPAASRAWATRLCGPSAVVVVFQSAPYGSVVSSGPRLVPSTLNWTPATPTLSPASATRATVPATVAPVDGLVSNAVGGVVSPTGASVVNVRSGESARLPAASADRTR